MKILEKPISNLTPCSRCDSLMSSVVIDKRYYLCVSCVNVLAKEIDSMRENSK